MWFGLMTKRTHRKRMSEQEADCLKRLMRLVWSQDEEISKVRHLQRQLTNEGESKSGSAGRQYDE